MIQKKKFSDAIAANISVVGGLLATKKLYPYMEDKQLLTSDFNEISKSGYCMIRNGQTMLNKPGISDNFWIVESIKVEDEYLLVRVTNLTGQHAYRTCNAGAWSKWNLG